MVGDIYGGNDGGDVMNEFLLIYNYYNFDLNSAFLVLFSLIIIDTYIFSLIRLECLQFVVG